MQKRQSSEFTLLYLTFYFTRSFIYYQYIILHLSLYQISFHLKVGNKNPLTSEIETCLTSIDDKSYQTQMFQPIYFFLHSFATFFFIYMYLNHQLYHLIFLLSFLLCFTYSFLVHTLYNDDHLSLFMQFKKRTGPIVFAKQLN